MTSPRPAVLFDLDGTLLDTNYFHTVSWWYALREAGEDIAMSRIHPLIGMGFRPAARGPPGRGA